MAKISPKFRLQSYGIYSKWEGSSKVLPKIKAYTTEIPAEIDIEFGLIIKVKKGKGIKLNYCVYHPDLRDENGQVMAPFSGEVFVNNNDWDFFLGDTIWEPIDEKTGTWTMELRFEGKVVAEKAFEVSLEHLEPMDEFALLRRKVSKNC